jgi:hypothetical protein
MNQLSASLWSVRSQRMESCQFVVNGLVGRDIRFADAGVKTVQVFFQQSRVEFQLEVAGRTD